VPFTIICGECEQCRRGNHSVCELTKRDKELGDLGPIGLQAAFRGRWPKGAARRRKTVNRAASQTVFAFPFNEVVAAFRGNWLPHRQAWRTSERCPVHLDHILRKRICRFGER
jgi:hypothetical protein